MNKRILAIAMSILLTLSLIPAMSFASANVAEVDGQQYATLSEAVNSAQEGSTVKLLGDVTENVTINQDITVDGEGKYTIMGLTTVKNGTVKNITLKPNPSDANGRLLSLGNPENVSINLENVTVNYSVVNRSGGSASTLSGNDADITIKNCHFINEANNNGNLLDAMEWSYGIYINSQGANGYIKFIETEFNGAFRTMIPSADGKMLIDGCKFINSVYSVLNGPTSGSGAEATTITTSDGAHNDIKVTNSTFDNAGAIYLQTNATFENNHFIMDKEMHYIQTRGRIESPVDFSKNTFDLGDNNIVIIDIPAAPVILPVGLPAVDYYVWADTPEDKRPVDYSDYKYTYDEDGSIKYIPQSDVALEQILTQTAGNKQVSKGDVILIEKDLTFPEMNIEKDRDFDIDVSENSTLNMPSALGINSRMNIGGNGNVHIPKGSNISISEDGGLNIAHSINLLNDGDIDNDGDLTIPDNTKGDGTISGDGNTDVIHDIRHVEALAPTCTAVGNIDHWYCSSCDKYYLDGEAIEEVAENDVFLPMTAHTYEDGVCTACGAEDPDYVPEDKPGVDPDDKPGDKPDDEPGDKPDDEPGDKPNDEPGDKPNDEPGDKPNDEPGDKPNDKPGDKPDHEPGDKPSDKPDAPQTSDNNHVATLLVLLVSAILSASVLAYKKNDL